MSTWMNANGIKVIDKFSNGKNDFQPDLKTGFIFSEPKLRGQRVKNKKQQFWSFSELLRFLSEFWFTETGVGSLNHNSVFNSSNVYGP